MDGTNVQNPQAVKMSGLWFVDYLEEEVKESQKTPQQLLFQLADNMIVNEGKHVFLKILCDNLSEEEAKYLIDELISYGL